MSGSYRASIGHNPKILVKRAQPRFSGGPIGFAIAPVQGGGGVTLGLNDGVENGFPTNIYNPALQDGAGILESSTTHAREGTRSMHTRVTKNGTANFRQEYRMRTPYDNDPSAGSEMYWLGFSLYVDPISTILSQSVIFQFHTVTSNSGASPVISVRMINDRWQFTSDSLPDELFGPTIVKGVWHDWVWQVLWRTNNTGICKMWLNGTLYIDKANMRTTWAGENNVPWIHVGSYSSAWKLAGNTDPQGTIHDQYHDSFRIVMDNNAAYGDVAPLGNRLTAP